MLEFRVLGPLEVCRSGQPVSLPGRASRRVLAALALRAGTWVSVDRLIDELWGERPPTRARNALQTHVWRLRGAFAAGAPDAEQVIRSGSAGYRLEVDTEAVDAARFERLIGDAGGALGRAEPVQGRALLIEALGLWRGPPLSELSLDGALAGELERLEELRLGAIEQRIDADLQLGAHHGLIGELRRLVAEYPLRERLHAQLMLALYRAGRQAEALEAYRSARTQLVEQLGIEPGPRLREVHQAVLAQDLALDAPPAFATASALPVPSTSLFGREADLERLAALVADARLVTLIGPGGVGKTRLAIEAARRLAAGFADGTGFVALAPLADPRELAVRDRGRARRAPAGIRAARGDAAALSGRPAPAARAGQLRAPAGGRDAGRRAARRLPAADDPRHQPRTAARDRRAQLLGAAARAAGRRRAVCRGRAVLRSRPGARRGLRSGCRERPARARDLPAAGRAAARARAGGGPCRAPVAERNSPRA